MISIESSTVRPQATVLTAEQRAEIHSYSTHLLATVGVRVDSEQARRLLAAATGQSAEDGLVRIPPELVSWALQVAPSVVDVYNQADELSFRLGADSARFGIGVTALYYQEPTTDHVVPFARQHMSAVVRLGEALGSFDVISTVGILQDMPPQVADLYATLEMVANTRKPLVLLISDDQQFAAALDLVEHLRGGLASRPFLIPYFNPITPLVINRDTCDKMLATVRRGLPFIYSNYGMVGASTPIEPAATLALLNAELLAGLVLTQLMREGAPIILGNLPAYFDMRGMGNFYAATSYLLNLACAEMMHHYGLPHCGTSGSGMGWGADLIAGANQWMNHLLSVIGKVGLAPFVGDNLGSKAFAPAVIVYADEVISQVRRFADGFTLAPSTVALEEIAYAGPGGSFLTTRSTLRGFRKAYYNSPTFPNLGLEEWQSRGQPAAVALLRQRTRELMDTSAPPPDHGALMERGEEFIRSQPISR
jgi:trimethylamine---corrinoid protein Co-methyltransferase